MEHLVIFDAKGKIVQEYSQTNTFGITSLTAGLYIVEVEIDNKYKILKLIVE